MRINEGEVLFEASRSSGPGGQHVQKTSTRIGIRWSVSKSAALNQEEKELVFNKLANRINKEGEVILHVETHRSQYRNKVLALKLLNHLVEEALKKPKKRKKTKPSKRSIEKRLQAKSQTGRKKELRKPLKGSDYH